MSGVQTKVEAIPAISFRHLIGIAGMAFALSYASVVASLAALWSTYPLYSHGYVVPLIAGWLAWTKYRENPLIQRKPDYVLGIPLILGGVALLIIGHVGAILTVKQTSLIVALAGFVLVFFGRQTFKFYGFPFAYLLFMVPIWDVVLNRLQDPSRLISARIASAFLSLANVPILRQDTTLILPSATLNVMPECSGVNQLVAVTAMSLPAAYIFLDTIRRRVALITFAVVVGYASNGFRIALVGWFAENGLGDGDLAGAYTHLLEGLVVSAVGYGLILLALSCLARFNGTRRDAVSAPLTVPEHCVSYDVARRRVLDLAVIAVLLIASLVPLVGGSADVRLARNLERLPGTLGAWRLASLDPAPSSRLSGIKEDLVGAYRTSVGVRQFAGVDDEISLVYESPSAVRLRVYVGYYRRQEEGRELAGDAGQVLATASTPVSFGIGSETVTAREVVRAADGVERGILYWYDINGRIVSDTYRAKVHTLWNGLTRRRTNGAVIMITWEGTTAANRDGRAEAISFARELLPVLRNYFNG
jgi:EpsI family protein